MTTRSGAGPRVRRLLLVGYAGIFAVWVISAYALTQRMSAADDLAADVRTRFLRNDESLSAMRANVLLSSVYLRDALVETSPAKRAWYPEEIRRLRAQIDGTLATYEPLTSGSGERRNLARLQDELQRYWDSTLPVIAGTDLQTSLQARTTLIEAVIPKRQSIIEISDRIHELNQMAFQEAQREVSALRRGVRRRVWETSVIAVSLGLIVAFLATRHAGRLEARLALQRKEEELHQHELERLSSKLMQAQEDERRRIARELHDEIGQALSAIKLELAVVEKQGLSRATTSLAEARTITERALQQVRDMSQLLHPSMLDDLGLPEATTWHLNGFSRRTGINTGLTVENVAGRMPSAVEICIYRVIQEAVTNVARHAQATTCHVEIRGVAGAVRVTVEDNGRGFNAQAPASADRRGLGLISVRERVATLGGTLHVDSRTGEGTRLTVELPLEEHAWAS